MLMLRIPQLHLDLLTVINLLVRPLVWVSVKYPVQYEGYQWEQLMGDLKIDLKFPSKAQFESDPILGWSRGLQNPYYWGGQSG